MTKDERKKRLERLQTATKDYVGKELERIDRDVLFLEQAKASRGAGATMQSQVSSFVTSEAEAKLEWYLKGL